MLKTFLHKYKHAWLLLYIFIYLPWFMYVEKKVTTHFHVIHMNIDDKIPFIEYFIIPYFLWFIYISITVLYFLFTNKSEYYKLCTFLFVGMTIFLIVSTVYPNGHYLRPHTFVRDNIFVDMVKALYRTDTSTNIFPSIHVYNSICAHTAIRRNQKLREHKWVVTGSFLLMISICMSTVFLKQHSMFDVLTGIIMAIVVYSLVYVVDYSVLSSQRKEQFKEV